MPGKDYKLRAALEGFKYAQNFPPLKTAALHPVQDVYMRNLERVYGQHMLQFGAISVAYDNGRILGRTEAKVGRRDRKRLKSELEIALQKHSAARDALLAAGPVEQLAVIAAEERRADEIMRVAAIGFPHYAEGWLLTMVPATWTAIEAMAEDLWVTALNIRPRGLAELKGRQSRRKAEALDGKQINLQLLQKYDYDLSSNMGNILKRKYSFDRLDDIRSAYSDAFYEDYSAIDAAVSDKSLDAICIIRNNVIHNAGIIDVEYDRRSADLPAELRAPIGSAIPVDGKIVARLLQPALGKSHALLVAVDDWLEAH